MVSSYAMFESYDHINKEIFLSSLQGGKDISLTKAQMGVMSDELEAGIIECKALLVIIKETYGL